MSAEIATLHVPFKAALERMGIPFSYQRPDQATGATLGDADFICYWKGFALHIEMKDKNTAISANQKKRHAELARAGCRVHIVRDMAHAEALVAEWRSLLGDAVDLTPAATEQREQAASNLRRFGQSVGMLLPGGGYRRLRMATPADAGIPHL